MATTLGGRRRGQDGVAEDPVEGKMYGKRDMKGAMAMFKQVKSLTAEVETLAETLDTTECELLRKKTDILAIDEQLKENEVLLQSLKKQLGVAQKSLNASGSKASGATAVAPNPEKERQIEEVEDARRAVNTMTEELKTMKLKMQNDDVQNAQLYDELTSLEEQLSALQSGGSSGVELAVQELENQAANLEDELTKIKEETKKVKKEVSGANKELSISQRELLDVQMKLGGKPDITELQKEQKSVSDDLHRVQGEINDAKKKAMEAASAGDDEAQKLATQLSALQDKLEEERTGRDDDAMDRMSEIFKANKALAKAQKEVNASAAFKQSGVLEDIETAKEDCEKLKKEITEQKKANEARKKNKAEDIKELNAEINGEQTKLLNLKTDKKKAEEAIAEKKKKIAELEEAICAKLEK